MVTYKKINIIEMHPIGVIHSPFKSKSETPIQPVFSSSIGEVEVFSSYLDGLIDLDGFSHIILIYYFNNTENFQLKVKPFLDNKVHGLFSTRHPNRPNPIGISIVEIIQISGNLITVKGIDVIDLTPLLDIKPYIPDFDVRTSTRTGWYKNRNRNYPEIFE